MLLTNKAFKVIDGRKTCIYVIPGWIYKALVRNRINITEFSNYAKVSSVLSINDMTAWLYMNDHYTILKNSLSNDYLSTLFNQELSLNMSLALTVEETKQTVNSKLNINTMTNAKTEDCYSFLFSEGYLFIILNEGFGHVVNNMDKLKKFITDYLKALYTVKSISETSLCPLYKLYIELL